MNQISSETAALAHSITARVPLAVVALRPQFGGLEMKVSYPRLEDWRILVSAPDALGTVVTHVVDPDGDSIKNLFESPQEAADYVVSQLLPSAGGVTYG